MILLADWAEAASLTHSRWLCKTRTAVGVAVVSSRALDAVFFLASSLDSTIVAEVAGVRYVGDLGGRRRAPASSWADFWPVGCRGGRAEEASWARKARALTRVRLIVPAIAICGNTRDH